MPAKEALAAVHARARRARRRDHDDGAGARLDDDAAAAARHRVRSVGDGSRDVARDSASRSRSRTRRVIVCNGDGSMLMNLGSLVSIAGAGATNLVVLVFDNGVYEVTGSQPTPVSASVDFAAIARGAGFTSRYSSSLMLDTWQAQVATGSRRRGRCSYGCASTPVLGFPVRVRLGPPAERARRLMDALSGGQRSDRSPLTTGHSDAKVRIASPSSRIAVRRRRPVDGSFGCAIRSSRFARSDARTTLIYSSRSASVGCTPAARRAGTQHATVAITRNSMAIDA